MMYSNPSPEHEHETCDTYIATDTPHKLSKHLPDANTNGLGPDDSEHISIVTAESGGSISIPLTSTKERQNSDDVVPKQQHESEQTPPQQIELGLDSDLSTIMSNSPGVGISVNTKRTDYSTVSSEHMTPSTSIDFERHLRSADHRNRRQEAHEWHSFLSRQPPLMSSKSTTSGVSPPTSSESAITKSTIDSDENHDQKETLLSVTAEAMADVLRGRTGPDSSSGYQTTFDEEIYNSFICTLVDCVPLVRTDNQTVVTTLLRRTAYVLHVPTVTSWYDPQNQADPSRISEPSSQHLIASVLLLGDGSPQISEAEQKKYRKHWKTAKRRMLRRALLLAAAPFYGEHGTADSIQVHVMLSYTLTLTTTLAALSRFGCTAAMHQFAPGRSEFAVVAHYHEQKLAFAVSFANDAPCNVRFYHPGIMALKIVDVFWDLVGDIRAAVEDVERKVLTWECARRSSETSFNTSHLR